MKVSLYLSYLLYCLIYLIDFVSVLSQKAYLRITSEMHSFHLAKKFLLCVNHEWGTKFEFLCGGAFDLPWYDSGL